MEEFSSLMLNHLLRWISYGLAMLALAGGGALFFDAARPGVLPNSPVVLTAAPLLLAGASFLVLQPILRLGGVELLRNVLLAGAFLLWGFVQLKPQNATSARLGNVVIALYVVDLAWMIFGSKISAKRG